MNAWGSSFGVSWGVSFGSSTPTPTPTPAVGGGGGKGSRLDKRVSKWVDESAKDLYAKLIAKDMPKAVRREAAAVVKPFVTEERKAKVPAIETINWQAVWEGERAALQAILERQIEEEDEMILIHYYMTMH